MGIKDIKTDVEKLNSLINDNQIKLTDHCLATHKYFTWKNDVTIPDEWKCTNNLETVNLECMGIKEKQVLIHKLSTMIMNNEIHYIQYKPKDGVKDEQ